MILRVDAGIGYIFATSWLHCSEHLRTSAHTQTPCNCSTHLLKSLVVLHLEPKSTFFLLCSQHALVGLGLQRPGAARVQCTLLLRRLALPDHCSEIRHHLHSFHRMHCTLRFLHVLCWQSIGCTPREGVHPASWREKGPSTKTRSIALWL